jgi:hypothetical protein
MSQVSVCYKTRIDKPPIPSLHYRRLREVHLLRKLPPSCRETGAPAETKYSLEVTLTGTRVPREYRRIVSSLPITHHIA